MEKKVLAISEKELEFDTVLFQGQVVNVKKRLSAEDIVSLVGTYISEYFSVSEVKTQVILAEYALQTKVMDVATDVQIDEDSISSLVSTSLVEDVISKISNYPFVLDIIKKTIQKVELDNSFEKKLSILADKAIEAVGKLSESGFDKALLEDMKEIVKDVSKLNINTEPVKREQKSKKENGSKNAK